MCATTTLICFGVFCVSSSCLFLRDETIELFNSWPPLLDYYTEGGELSTLNFVRNTKTAILISALAHLDLAAAVGAPIFYSFAFRALPLCLMPTAEVVGLIPQDGSIPWMLIWKLLFFPLEKLCIKKRGKATRAIGISIGDLMEFSLDVPMGVSIQSPEMSVQNKWPARVAVVKIWDTLPTNNSS